MFFTRILKKCDLCRIFKEEIGRLKTAYEKRLINPYILAQLCRADKLINRI